jgi:hypothetical protein
VDDCPYLNSSLVEGPALGLGVPVHRLSHRIKIALQPYHHVLQRRSEFTTTLLESLMRLLRQRVVVLPLFFEVPTANPKT